MALKVYWSPDANEQLNLLYDYLESNWSSEVVIEFSVTLEEFLAVISGNPKSFPFSSRRKTLRRCVITKHNSLFYREYLNSIEIVALFDTRQNPSKLKSFLKKVK